MDHMLDHKKGEFLKIQGLKSQRLYALSITLNYKSVILLIAKYTYIWKWSNTHLIPMGERRYYKENLKIYLME